MSFLKKIFKKKSKKELKYPNLHDISVDDEGNVNGTYRFKVSGEEEEIPINTTLSAIEASQKRSEDKHSVERNPKDGEITLSIDFPVHKLKGSEKDCDEILEAQNIATLKGFNNFIISEKLLNRLKKETEKYDKHNELLDRVARLNNRGIELEKKQEIEKAIEVYEEAITTEYPATHSYERLMILYRKQKEVEKEKTIIEKSIKIFEKENKRRARSAIKEYQQYKEKILQALKENKEVYKKDGMICFNPYDTFKYKKRLNTLINKDRPKEKILPTSATIFKAEQPTLGHRYEVTKKRFKEFDFYNSNEDRSDSFLKDQNKEEIFKIKNIFKDLIEDGKVFESEGDYVSAAKLYEHLIAENYYLTYPYDRLIKIYSRAKLVKDEERVLKYAINYFSSLRIKQQNYVLSLAKKYNKLDFAKEKIITRKKITYYGGAFELYNPFPKIEKWKEHLNKKYS